MSSKPSGPMDQFVRRTANAAEATRVTYGSAQGESLNKFKRLFDGHGQPNVTLMPVSTTSKEKYASLCAQLESDKVDARMEHDSEEKLNAAYTALESTTTEHGLLRLEIQQSGEKWSLAESALKHALNAKNSYMGLNEPGATVCAKDWHVFHIKLKVRMKAGFEVISQEKEAIGAKKRVADDGDANASPKRTASLVESIEEAGGADTGPAAFQATAKHGSDRDRKEKIYIAVGAGQKKSKFEKKEKKYTWTDFNTLIGRPIKHKSQQLKRDNQSFYLCPKTSTSRCKNCCCAVDLANAGQHIETKKHKQAMERAETEGSKQDMITVLLTEYWSRHQLVGGSLRRETHYFRWEALVIMTEANISAGSMEFIKPRLESLAQDTLGDVAGLAQYFPIEDERMNTSIIEFLHTKCFPEFSLIADATPAHCEVNVAVARKVTYKYEVVEALMDMEALRKGQNGDGTAASYLKWLNMLKSDAQSVHQVALNW